MPAWINRTPLTGASTATNGTNSHTCTFTPATSGNFLVAIVAASATCSTPSGWTLVISGISDAAIYTFVKVASSGESTFTTTHNGSNWPMEGIVYEFPAGSLLIGTPGSANNTTREVTYNGPTCTGLTGSYTRFSARSWNLGNGSTIQMSHTWSIPSVEDYDKYIEGGSVGGWQDGVVLGVAYDDNSTGSSFTPSSIASSSGGVPSGGAGEAISFAITVPSVGIFAAPWITA